MVGWYVVGVSEGVEVVEAVDRDEAARGYDGGAVWVEGPFPDKLSALNYPTQSGDSAGVS
jgi:hypothetical protein